MNKLNKEVKRNDLEIVSVKEWGSPRFNVQLFMPQVYCDPCAYESVTHLPSWTNDYDIHYIDLDGDGVYDSGERYDNLGKVVYTLGVSNQTTKGNVRVCYIQVKAGTNKWNGTYHTLTAGDPYAQHQKGGNTYRPAAIGSGFYKIKIEDGNAYYYTVNAS